MIEKVIEKDTIIGKSKGKGKNRNTMLHTKGQARRLTTKGDEPLTTTLEVNLNASIKARAETMNHDHKIQEYDPVPAWFETEGHGTTIKQKMTDVRKGLEKGLRPPKNIYVIAYNHDTAEAYSNAGKLSIRLGQEFPLLATKKICIEGGTAALIKLDAMICMKCHYNEDDMINNQWHKAASVSTPHVLER